MRRTVLSLSLVFVLLAATRPVSSAAPSGAAQDRPPAASHAFSVHDMLAMDRISDSRVSPDGRTIAFTLRATDLEANRGRTDIWLVGADGRDLRRLTSHPAADTSARWCRDGRGLYFLSTRSGSSQVWRILARRGRGRAGHGPAARRRGPRRLAGRPDARRDHGGLPRPDRRRRPPPRRSRPGARTRPRAASSTSSSSGTGTAWSDGRRSHLFAVSGPGGEAGTSCRPWTPTRPASPSAGPRRSPSRPTEGGRLHRAGRRPRGGLVDELRPLRRRRSTARRPPRCLTAGEQGLGHDARLLARREDAGLSGHGPARLRGRPLPHRAHALARRRGAGPRADRGLGLLGRGDRPGRPDGDSSSWSTAPNKGQTSLFAVDANDRPGRDVVGERDGAPPSRPAGERIVFERNNLRSPTELYSVAPDGSDERAVDPHQRRQGRRRPPGRARAVHLRRLEQ